MIELTFDATGLRRWAQLRWSLADPVASVAINMPLQKELFASSRVPRRRVQDAYKEQVRPPACTFYGLFRSFLVIFHWLV